MDNVSHTLAGMLAAEALVALRGARRRAALPENFGRVAWITSAVANNLPDADILYSLVDPTKLGYLLHHRGHTHTLLVGWPLGLLVLLLPWWWARRGRHDLGREGWLQLLLLTLLGPVLHLTFDGLNNYGIHPFWPLSNRWFYGDTIFILEPYFWVCAIPLLLPSMRSKAARGLWIAVLLLGLGPVWLLPFVPRLQALGLTVLGLGLLWIPRRFEVRARIGVALGLCVLGLGAFAIGRARADAAVRTVAASDFRDWRLHDVVLTPLPSNPLCWEALLVMTRASRDYAIRRAEISPWSSLWPVERCPPFSFSQPSTAPLSKIGVGSSAPREVRWEREHLAPLGAIRERVERDCAARAILRFTRVPFLVPEGTEQSRGLPVIGDLRYDREVELGFAEVVIKPGDEGCPKHDPPWEWPRQDVLE